MKSHPRYLEFCGLYIFYVLGIHLIKGPWQGWTSQQRTLDEWTLTHLTWGYLGQKFKIPLSSLLLLSIGNEVLEAYLRQIKFLGIWGDPETIANIAGDLGVTSLGWLTRKKLTEGSI